MSFDSTALPDDVEALHRLIAVEREELAAARAGLMAKALESEKPDLILDVGSTSATLP